jgi:hypothetical protein
MSTYNSLLLLSSLSLVSASPLYIISPPKNILKRTLTTGTKAGLGIGIAVAAILLVLIVTFFIIHFRHVSARKREQSALVKEKPLHSNGSVASSEFGASTDPQPITGGIPRRSKSVKDRLMGPLYRGSTIDLMPMPRQAKLADDRSMKGMSALEEEMNQYGDYLNKPWVKPEGGRSPIPSFSSKRATRMMMMM